MKPVADSHNRRLIRPSLNEVKEQRSPDQKGRPNRSKKATPPEQTHAESYYLVKQMQNRTPMVVVLRDGEEVHGVIEWYDRACLKINRKSGPNLVVYKENIKYIYKDSREAANGAEPD